jgi:hypothetical protein
MITATIVCPQPKAICGLHILTLAGIFMSAKGAVKNLNQSQAHKLTD